MRSLSTIVFGSALALAQSANLTFDVASVKVSPPLTPERLRALQAGLTGGPGTEDPGRMTWAQASLRQVLQQAYGLSPYELVGPAWLDTDRFDFAMVVPEGATREQTGTMWQNLLAERFALKVHRETKEMPVDELVVGRNGHKLKQTAIDPGLKLEGPPKILSAEGTLDRPGLVTLLQIRGNTPVAQMIGAAQPLSGLAKTLSNQLNHPVLDKTGLSGLYDFRVEYTPEVANLRLNGGTRGAQPPDPGIAPGTDLADAIQQQLGLRLQRGRGNVEVLVVDGGNRVPAEN